MHVQERSIWQPCSLHGYVQEAPGTTSLVFICSVNILLKTAEVSVSFVYVNKQHE